MADRKVFTDSVHPLPNQSGLTPHGLMVNLERPTDKTQPLPLLFSLAIPAEKKQDLEAKVAAGQVVSRKDLASIGPDAAASDQLVSWLKGQGYTIDQVTSDHTGIYAHAPISAIEQSLQVNMVPVTKDGVTYSAAQNAPSLPSDIGDPVHAIVGLQPYRRANKHFRQDLTREALGPTAALNNAPPYLPAEILGAYGAGTLGLNGQGQTIAILIDTFPNDADLQAFWTAAGVNVTLAQISKINVGGGTLPAATGEETLDVSWASGIAPGANIRVYASGDLALTSLDQALDAIIADLPNYPNLSQLSISLGLGETYMPQGEAATEHQKFLKLAAAGVNVFVSTGDAGSNPGQDGHTANGPLQAEYQSTDPAVIAVGGTTLTLAGDGSIASETSWPSGGGGRSTIFGNERPAWQTGTGVPDGTDRLVPDVCAAADPNTGAYLVLNGNTTSVGGTSWSAPTWAGLCALINQSRLSAGKAALGYANPSFYPLLGTSSFLDITSGSNGAYTAGPGYDMVTGIGSPNVAQLIANLP